LGPASYAYVVTAADKHQSTLADDTYLIVLAANVPSCADEFTQDEHWVDEKNISLNPTKSMAIVNECIAVEQTSAVPRFVCTESTEALGVSFFNTEHFDNRLRLVFVHGAASKARRPNNALRAVCKASCHNASTIAWWVRQLMQITGRRSFVAPRSSASVQIELLQVSQVYVLRLMTSCSDTLYTKCCTFTS